MLQTLIHNILVLTRGFVPERSEEFQSANRYMHDFCKNHVREYNGIFDLISLKDGQLQQMVAAGQLSQQQL